MVILHNPESGADINSNFLTLRAGESAQVSEVVAREAVRRWGFLSIAEAFEPIEELVEIPAEKPHQEDLNTFTVADLRKKANEVGVKYTGLVKKELVKKLRRKV